MYGRGFLFGNEDIPSRKERFLQRLRFLRNAVQSLGTTLTSGLFLSVFFHGILIAGILVFTRNSGMAGAALKAKDIRPVLRAMKDLAAEVGQADSGMLPAEEVGKLIESLSNSPLFSSAFSENERTEILKNMLRLYRENRAGFEPTGEAESPSLEKLLALLRQAGGVKLGPADRIFARGSRERDQGPAFFKVDRGAAESLGRMKAFDKAHAAEPLRSSGDLVAVPDVNGENFIPKDYYFRDSPYEEMMARGAYLFLFAAGFPDVAPAVSSSKKTGILQPAAMNREVRNLLGSDRLVLFIQAAESKTTRGGRRSLKPPLLSAAGERQRILDGMMSLPEEKQVALFQERYLAQYDPDYGALPDLFREFIYGNLSSVFLVADPFVAGFDFLEELYFSKSAMGLILDAARLPDTRVGTEALFALASFYEFEERTIRRLLDVYQRCDQIIRGGEVPRNVQNPKTKAFVMNHIARDIVSRYDELAGMPNVDKLLEDYEREERKIYEFLLLRDGEDRARALFGLGCQAWRRQSCREAVDLWKKIDRSFEFRIYKEIRRKIDLYDTRRGSEIWRFRELVADINLIFERDPAGEREKRLQRMMAFRKWAVRTDASKTPSR